MTALPSMQTPRHPDETADMADELTEADMLWCIRQIEPDWCLYYETIDGAFNDLWKRNPDRMDALIREVDEDNAAALDPGDLCLTLAEIVSPEEVWLLPRQAGDRR